MCTNLVHVQHKLSIGELFHKMETILFLQVRNYQTEISKLSYNFTKSGTFNKQELENQMTNLRTFG